MPPIVQEKKSDIVSKDEYSLLVRLLKNELTEYYVRFETLRILSSVLSLDLKESFIVFQKIQTGKNHISGIQNLPDTQWSREGYEEIYSQVEIIYENLTILEDELYELSKGIVRKPHYD